MSDEGALPKPNAQENMMAERPNTTPPDQLALYIGEAAGKRSLSKQCWCRMGVLGLRRFRAAQYTMIPLV